MASTDTNPFGPVGSTGYAGNSVSGLSPQSETWVMLALFGVAALALLFWGWIGGNLNVGASVGGTL